jgi:aminoglycoside 2''-phosphotransferase
MNKIERLILQACPDLKVESLDYLNEGNFCRVYLVNVQMVFRFAKHGAAQKSLRRELCLLPKIAPQVSLQIPEPEFSLVDGKPQDSFIAYRFLPDTALTREEYLKLDDKSRTRCAEQVAAFLSDLHAFDVKLAENCGVRAIDYFEKYTKLLKRFGKKLAGRIEKAEFEFAARIIENYLESPETKAFQPVLLHGDLSPDHVLFDGERVTSIIDFGDLMIGDAAWDFLWIYEDYGADFFARAISKYNTKDKELFKERVVRLSNLEAIQWFLDCFEQNGDLSEALDNLKSLSKNQLIF